MNPSKQTQRSPTNRQSPLEKHAEMEQANLRCAKIMLADEKCAGLAREWAMLVLARKKLEF